MPWNTETGKDAVYCVHANALFPTWHRPYMLLYEQRLYEIMRDLIPTTFASADHAAMFHAAETWRLPFWDWARKKPTWDASNPDSPKNDPGNPVNLGPGTGPNVPFILTQKTVEVKTKTEAASVPNPMWRFILPKTKQYPDGGNFKAYGISNPVACSHWLLKMTTPNLNV
jgi:tyrosinase